MTPLVKNTSCVLLAPFLEQVHTEKPQGNDAKIEKIEVIYFKKYKGFYRAFEYISDTSQA